MQDLFQFGRLLILLAENLVFMQFTTFQRFFQYKVQQPPRPSPPPPFFFLGGGGWKGGGEVEGARDFLHSAISYSLSGRRGGGVCFRDGREKRRRKKTGVLLRSYQDKGISENTRSGMNEREKKTDFSERAGCCRHENSFRRESEREREGERE